MTLIILKLIILIIIKYHKIMRNSLFIFALIFSAVICGPPTYKEYEACTSSKQCT